MEKIQKKIEWPYFLNARNAQDAPRLLGVAKIAEDEDPVGMRGTDGTYVVVVIWKRDGILQVEPLGATEGNRGYDREAFVGRWREANREGRVSFFRPCAEAD
jgi:hypothetical protein